MVKARTKTPAGRKGKRSITRAPLPAPRPSAGSGLREALGVTIDADEGDWRPLTGDGNRDLTPLTQARMQEIAVYLWETNLLANRLVELPVAYLLAEGASLTVPNEDAQTWLNAFWNDPINAMDRKLAKKVRELALYGEQCWPAFVNEFTGHVRLGYLAPDRIERVVADPDNVEQPIGIITKANVKGEQRRYRIIVNGPEQALFTDRTRRSRRTFNDGECFFFAVNDLSDGCRGRSDLLAHADWLDAYEQFLFGEVERTNFLRAFIWDVTLKGATPEEVAKRAREIVTPRPGSTRVHNESEEWKTVTSQLEAMDSSEIARLFRNHILGGGTVPEHWYGGAADVNRATAGAMGDPTHKMLSMRQTTLKHMLVDVAKYQIRQRLLKQRRNDIDPASPEPEYEPVANFPELSTKDIPGTATAFQQVTAAVVTALDRGIVSRLTAVSLVAIVAARLGLDIDPAAELVSAEQDALRQAEQDRIPEIADDPSADDEPAAAAE